jgi:hypothetical protein
MSVRRNPASGDYEVQDREELRRLPDVQLWDEEEELEGDLRDGGEEE